MNRLLLALLTLTFISCGNSDKSNKTQTENQFSQVDPAEAQGYGMTGTWEGEGTFNGEVCNHRLQIVQTSKLFQYKSKFSCGDTQFTSKLQTSVQNGELVFQGAVIGKASKSRFVIDTTYQGTKMYLRYELFDQDTLVTEEKTKDSSGDKYDIKSELIILDRAMPRL